MKNDTKFSRLLRSFCSYLMVFLFVSFTITCCLMLFVSTLSQSLEITFTGEHLNAAAKLTFANVLLLSLLFLAADALRRRYMVERPVKQITEAAEKIMQGNFSVRIAPIQSMYAADTFNPIIQCFNSMAQELSGTQTLRTDFISNVSHEIKTPLAVMQNYAAMLQQPGLPEETRMAYGKAISSASRRLAGLITNILRLNKLENQQIAPLRQVYDLSEQVCQCLLSFEDAWEEKGLAIETDLEDGIYVSSDPEMMTLVWNNLFSNAIKFTEPGGKITLSLKTADHKVMVRISDTGCGISQEVGRRMFDKFYQGDISHATQGNGLGLALVKRVVDITGCSISVESELGKGSTFTVTMGRYEHEVLENHG